MVVGLFGFEFGDVSKIFVITDYVGQIFRVGGGNMIRNDRFPDMIPSARDKPSVAVGLFENKNC